MCRHAIPKPGRALVPCRPPTAPRHGLTSDRLLRRAFAAGFVVLFVLAAVAAPDEGLLPMSISLWLTHGGRMATEGATEGGAGRMSIPDCCDGCSAGERAEPAGWRASRVSVGLLVCSKDALLGLLPSSGPELAGLLRQAPICTLGQCW